MVDDFAHLHGRWLVPFARQADGSLEWDRIYKKAGRDVTLERDIIDAIRGRALNVPPALVAVFAALADGRLGLVADGDHTFGHAVGIMVPPGLLGGDYRIVADTDAGAYLAAEGPDGREVEPRYYRPRFAPPGTGDELPPPGSWPRLIITALTGWLHGTPDVVADDPDAPLVAEMHAAYQAMTLGRRSMRRAAAIVADRLIAEGKVQPATRDAWIEKLRKKK